MDSLIVALVAIRKRVCVRVVEETVVSVSPGELLQVGGGGRKTQSRQLAVGLRPDGESSQRPGVETLVRMRRWV